MAHLAPVSERISQPERELLEAAAAQANTNLSAFIRRKAVEAAEIELLERRLFTIPAARWKKDASSTHCLVALALRATAKLRSHVRTVEARDYGAGLESGLPFSTMKVTSALTGTLPVLMPSCI